MRARTALCHDDVATAKPLFDALAEVLPGNLEVKLCAAWAHARLATSISAGEREQLERLAREVLGAHELLAAPLCILAHAAIRRGELRMARSLFRRAAEADPALLDAERGLRLTDRRLRAQHRANSRLRVLS